MNKTDTTENGYRMWMVNFKIEIKDSTKKGNENAKCR